MYRDVQRWQREGNRSATIERTCGEMQEVLNQMNRLQQEHDNRLQSMVSGKHPPPLTLPTGDDVRFAFATTIAKTSAMTD
jgi:hypothetical protein